MKDVQILLLTLLATISIAGIQEGIEALNNGDYLEARKHFLPLAEAGDDKAMITIGLMYHQGQGVKQDYNQAMDWYIKAFKKDNGDAYSNIGVMYRDGFGVGKNKKMAYCLFLVTHVCGLGNESTQQRANSCLRRIVPEMSHDEVVECFNYTLEYIEAFVVSKGTLKGIPEGCQPSEKRLSLKDKPWWLKGELDFLKEEPNEDADKEKKANSEDLTSIKLANEIHSIEIKEILSTLIIRDENDRTYSGQIKSKDGLAEFEKIYGVKVEGININFNEQMLIFGVTDEISTRAFQLLKHKNLQSFTLDYTDTGIKYKLKRPDEGKKYSYLQIFIIKKVGKISHINVKNLLRNGLSKARS